MDKYEWTKQYLREVEKFLSGNIQNDLLNLFDKKQYLIPKSLYKYACLPSIEKEHLQKRVSTLKALETSHIWASNPKQFNDPYDCMPAYDIEEAILSDEDILKAENDFNVKFTKIDGKVTLGEFSNKMESLIEEEHGPINKSALEEARYKNNSQIYNVGAHFQQRNLIACFTEHNDNLPMWAHYSNNHSGYCLEYDFHKNSNIESWNLENSRQLYPVLYDTERPNSAGGTTEKFRSSLFKARLTKSKDWEYEAEWRYILPFPYSYSIEIEEKGRLVPAPKLTAIYLGLNTNSLDTEQLLHIGSIQKTPVYKMRQNHKSFSLRPELIEDFGKH